MSATFLPSLSSRRHRPLQRRALGPCGPCRTTRPTTSSRLSWNRRFDPRPSLIVRAADAADVAATVRLARDQGLPLTIRSGGHSLAGYSSLDDAILLDLGDLRGLTIDPRGAPRAGRSGPDRGRLRRRGTGIWPGDAPRRHRHGRHRRPDPGWRHRLAGAQVRPDHRFPRRRRRWSPRTATSSRSTRSASRSCSGASAAVAATSASSPASPAGSIPWTGSWAAPSCCRATADVVADVLGRRGRRAGGPDGHPGRDAPAADALRARRAARHAGPRGPGRLDRRRRGRPARPGAHPRHRPGHRRHGRPDALSGHLQPDRGSRQAGRRCLPVDLPGRPRPVDPGGAHRGHGRRTVTRLDAPVPGAGWRHGRRCQ